MNSSSSSSSSSSKGISDPISDHNTRNYINELNRYIKSCNDKKDYLQGK